MMENAVSKLKDQAGKLSMAADSLVTVLEQEKNRLERIDWIARLQEQRVATLENLRSAREKELMAHYRYSEVRAIRSGVRLIGGIIGAVSESPRLKSLSQELMRPPANGEPPFGTVLVCVGPSGIPDDVSVVSISQWAREQRSDEFRVVNEIRKAGKSLLTGEEFSRLIDRLSEGILNGRQSLPFKPRHVFEIRAVPQRMLTLPRKELRRVEDKRSEVDGFTEDMAAKDSAGRGHQELQKL